MNRMDIWTLEMLLGKIRRSDIVLAKNSYTISYYRITDAVFHNLKYVFFFFPHCLRHLVQQLSFIFFASEVP